MEGGLEFERLDEGHDVLLAGGGIVFCSHLLALLFEQSKGFLPVQSSFLCGAIVEKMHAYADVDAHSLKLFMSCLAVDDIVAEVELVFDGLNCDMGKVSGEPRVRLLSSRRAMNVRSGWLVLVLGATSQFLKRIGACIEVLIGEGVRLVVGLFVGDYIMIVNRYLWCLHNAIFA